MYFLPSQFVLCNRCTRSGLKKITCPSGLAFDIENQTCDWKAKVKTCDKKESKLTIRSYVQISTRKETRRMIYLHTYHYLDTIWNYAITNNKQRYMKNICKLCFVGHSYCFCKNCSLFLFLLSVNTETLSDKYVMASFHLFNIFCFLFVC